MTFVVITGNDRKRFDRIRDALNYSTAQSRIYQLDAFGNLDPLSNEDIEELLQYEPIARQSEETNFQEQDQNSEQDSVEEEQKIPKTQVQDTSRTEKEKVIIKKEEPKKRSPALTIFLYAVYIILILIIIYVAYLIISPYFKEFMQLSNDYGLN